MRRYLCGLMLLAALAFTPTTVSAQGSATVISTAGADCSVATNCAIIGVRGFESVGIYLNVGNSGTFVFEATIDADVSTATWFPINDDVGAVGSATVDGVLFFSNPGYSYIRLRASAISGNAAVAHFRGFAALKSLASLAGGGDASAANQATMIAALQAIEAATEALQADVATFNTATRFISAGAVEEFAVKTAAGTLMGFSASNSHATTDVYLKCSNATAANTTPGTTAIVFDIIIPATAGRAEHSIGMSFDTALTCYVVTGKADTDTTAVAANDFRITFFYR